MHGPWSDARTSRPALVLGGGGACGVVQAAYIYAAYEAGFRPSMVIGTSVGALNAGWLALRPDDPDGLLRIWRGLDHVRVLNLSPVRFASRLLQHRMSAFSNELVPKLIASNIGDTTFEDARIPLSVVATNLTQGCKQVFRDGPLGPAILASTAIPGLFEPVEIDGELYVDGMLTASVDLQTAMVMGATEILAISLEPPRSTAEPKTAYGVLKRSLSVLSGSTTLAMEACLKPQLPLKVVRPDISGSSAWRLDDSADALARNMDLAREELKEVLDGRGHVIDQRETPDIAGQEALRRDAGLGLAPGLWNAVRHTFLADSEREAS